MKRVAIYCRVSTDKKEQKKSLISQKEFLEKYISKNNNLTLEKVYLDIGSGLTVSNRTEFKNMIKDGLNHKYDLILTKDISRFSRNTLETLKYIRILKNKNIGIYFLKEDVFTLEDTSEIRITILSSLAQEESRKISDRVKFGQKVSMEKGVVFGRSVLGYDVKNGDIRVNKESSEIVKLIFSLAEKELSPYKIAKLLTNLKIPTCKGNLTWNSSSIHRILRNEKYIGDLVQQKTYTKDYISHKRVYNKGEIDFITIKNHHTPIIDRETFETVQKILDKRKK